VIRAVFDTNVLVSYLLTHRPPIATLIDRHLTQEDIVLVTAPELLEELDRILQYPKLQRYYTEEERTRFVALLMALSEVVELPETIPRICRDPDDDQVIACAVAGGDDVIVSGDRDLLVLKQVGDIPILVTHELVHLVERSHSDAFWERVERIIPDYADRQRWLKEHGGCVICEWGSQASLAPARRWPRIKQPKQELEER
jgi:putative PIN family toxin of toxin-antitoxin system